MEIDRPSLLGNIELFESLAHDNLGTLAERLDEKHFEAGDVIFHQGDPGATLFVIQSGAVEISFGEGKAAVRLATLSAGQYFGELSLLDGAPRSATATATKPTVLLALDRDDFVEFVRSDPEAALRIMSEIGERMRQTNELMSRQVTRNVLQEEEDKLTFGQRLADRIASFGGSWPFIGLFAGVMSLWMLINSAHQASFDPFPFILLNLVLSTLAALQAPVIMMSQNRQATKDKALAENDYRVNLKSELGIETLLRGQAELLARIGFVERQIEHEQKGHSLPRAP
jgi:uncharacterized membrane protein